MTENDVLLPESSSNPERSERTQIGAAAGVVDDRHASSTPMPNGFATSADRQSSLSVGNVSNEAKDNLLMKLEIEDGSSYVGTSFGSEKSIAGELVFQTGMVGYPESITDPSYRGQILIITFPLVGNYGVPSRKTLDESLGNLPAHFEASHIHIAGLVVASYSGEDYSHYLATSSLGTWLKEEGVPAMYGVDTRALTKKIREKGSMLGRLLAETSPERHHLNGTHGSHVSQAGEPAFEQIDWFDPNTRNLVADGETTETFSVPIIQI